MRDDNPTGAPSDGNPLPVALRDAESLSVPDAQARLDELSGRGLMAQAIAVRKSRGERPKVDEADYPPLTAAERLAMLALGEHLARYYRHPAGVHRAVTAGAGWGQVAAATGVSEDLARAAYRRWADGQRWLCGEYAGGFGMSEDEHAAAIRRAGSDVRTVVTVALMEHDYFVLTDALAEWAARQRSEAADAPDSVGMRLQWADAADHLLNRIEAALDSQPGTEGAGR